MVLPQFLCPFCCPGGCSKCECMQGKPNDVGKTKFGNCGNAIAEIGGINFWQLWQWHCRKWGKKKVTKSVKEKKKSCHVHNIFTTFSQ